MTYTERIEKIRSERNDLALLGHHYQSDAVIQHMDITGDSLELARKIDGLDAEHVVFCGVFFMAETAAVLCRDDQKIHIPDVNAACPMAEMANAGFVKRTLERLNASGRKIIPLTYVNSSAAVKAVVGMNGGSVCTSANAGIMMQWALDRGDAVLFLPDKHLGWNTAEELGIPEKMRHFLPEGVKESDPALHITEEADKARILLWPGYCPIHEEFLSEAIANVRAQEPDALIVVHPECPPEVTSMADANGSTSFIIKYVAEAPEGSTIYIGTEGNLVNRLANQYQGVKTIRPLKVSLCEDMGKTNEENLSALLENLDQAVPVSVPEQVKIHARIALQRMLEACK